MASGLLIQKGTALSQQTIFTSLRQNLIRRLLNTSSHMDDEIKVEIVENFTQSLVDSGHKFLFVKPIILQALTRFKYMQERDKLKLEDPRYKKLYRNKMEDFEERVKLKSVEKFSWYADGSLKDPWRDHWKFRVRRRGKDF